MRAHLLTTRDLDEMVRMFHAGSRAGEIGQRLRVSARAVRYHLAERGLRYQRGMTAQAQLALENRRGRIYLLRGRGQTLAQMAVELRLHPDALRVWLGRHMPELYEQMTTESAAQWRERLRKRPKRPQRTMARSFERQVRALYGRGQSIAAIARQLGRHPMTVWRVLRCRVEADRPRRPRRSGRAGARA